MTDMQALMFFLLWFTMITGFFWGIQILYGMAGHIGEIKGEIKELHRRIDNLAQRITQIQERSK